MQSEKVCDPEVYLRGSLVFMTHTIPAKDLNDWVRTLELKSKSVVDWHYMAGRACIRSLGNPEAVKTAIRTTIKQHDAAFNAELREIGMEGCMDPPRPDWW